MDIRHFEFVDARDHRIYAGARQRTRQFADVAAIGVLRLRARLPRRENYRKENLSVGYPWAWALEALTRAIQAGEDGASGPIGIPGGAGVVRPSALQCERAASPALHR